MKAKFTPYLKALLVFLVLVIVLGSVTARAQLPNCTSGNIMYAVFNNVGGSMVDDSVEIRSVNVTTGAVGGLVGGKRYYIFRIGVDSIFGTAALGVDQITNRFYLMTQMDGNNPMSKDIITINPVTAVQTKIGTTPTSSPNLTNYHFVKLAIAPNGYGYAIGVNANSGATASTFSPLIRFTTCGASPTTNCSTVTLLGYLPSSGIMNRYGLFNGDIAFDVTGNLYFVTAAYAQVGGIWRYTDARLFKINAANIPTTAGTGTITMNFVADYDGLDSTVVNGIGLDGNGNMYITTRRFTGVQTSPPGPSNSELWGSFAPGAAMQISGFSVPTANFSVADLASCYYPTTILGMKKFDLQYKYDNGKVNLKWEMMNTQEPLSYEVQRSDDGVNFEAIGTVLPVEHQAVYTYSDAQSGFGKNKFYRIRAAMGSGLRQYTNVVSVNFNSKISLMADMRPNPFTSEIQADVWMKAAGNISIRIMDQDGRVVHNRQLSGRTGTNQVKMDGLGSLKPGVYIVEMRVQDEVVREKVIKQN